MGDMEYPRLMQGRYEGFRLYLGSFHPEDCRAAQDVPAVVLPLQLASVTRAL